MNVTKCTSPTSHTPLHSISFHSIKIPTIQKQPSQARPRPTASGLSPVESDLTELSWLTNNIHFLPNPTLAEKPPIQRSKKPTKQPRHQQPQHGIFFPSSLSLSSSSSTSSSSSSPTSSFNSQFTSLPVSPASSTSSSNSTSPRSPVYAKNSIQTEPEPKISVSNQHHRALSKNNRSVF